MTTTTDVGQRVTTEWGPGAILAVTRLSVIVLLDEKEWGVAQTISLARGTHGWRRFVEANPEVTL